MSSFISLTRNIILQNEETIKLSLPRNFTKSSYKNFLDGIDFSQDNDFKQQLVNNPLREDVEEGSVSNQQFYRRNTMGAGPIRN